MGIKYINQYTQWVYQYTHQYTQMIKIDNKMITNDNNEIVIKQFDNNEIVIIV